MTSPHVTAARERARRGITDLLTAHMAEDRAAQLAADITDRLERDGWHHTSSHTQPPAPTRPRASESTIQDALAVCRAVVATARYRRQEDSS